MKVIKNLNTVTVRSLCIILRLCNTVRSAQAYGNVGYEGNLKSKFACKTLVICETALLWTSGVIHALFFFFELRCIYGQ